MFTRVIEVNYAVIRLVSGVGEGSIIIIDYGLVTAVYLQSQS